MKQLLTFALASAALILGSAALAGKTYTKQQLISMSNSGNLPAQGSPRTLATESMGFDSCVSRVRGLVASLEGYPYHIVLDIADAYSAKIWTNDAAMILTCSRLDKKLVITSSEYR